MPHEEDDTKTMAYTSTCIDVNNDVIIVISTVTSATLRDVNEISETRRRVLKFSSLSRLEASSPSADKRFQTKWQ